MRILIIGDGFSFPNGQGATARVLAVAKGLRDAGAEVQVLVTRTTEREEAAALNHHASGEYCGIPYEYTTGATIRPVSFWRRRWLEVKGIVGAARWVTSLGSPPFGAVLFFTVDALVLPLLIGLISKIRGAVLLYDGCELPFVYQQNSLRQKIYGEFYTRFVYKAYDGIFVISRYLEKRFVTWIRDGAQIIRIPILVDPSEFNRCQCNYLDDQKKRILYMGSLNHPGEVATLVQSFADIAQEYPVWHLQILGDVQERVLQGLKQLVADLNLVDRVEFVGMVKRQELPAYLTAASVLALPRASGEFSRAGFPTKLAEYLASGKPVILTSTGDIPDYLDDGVNAYLVPPDNVAAFSARLQYVLGHSGEAELVGQKGRCVAVEQFDYRLHGHRLLDFIQNLHSVLMKED